MRYILTLTTILSLNAFAAKCYDNESCSKLGVRLVKKSLTDHVCQEQGKAEIQALQAGQPKTKALENLEECFAYNKQAALIQNLSKNFK